MQKIIEVSQNTKTTKEGRSSTMVFYTKAQTQPANTQVSMRETRNMVSMPRIMDIEVERLINLRRR